MLTSPAGVVVVRTPVSVLGDTTTNSTSPILIGGMTDTPPAGTYLVRFIAAIYYSTSAGPYVEFSIYVGGIKVQESIQWMSGGHSLGIPVCVSAIVTVSGSQTIEARWAVSSSLYTAGIHNTRTLNLIQLG
jgi:hypothetical protein